MICAGRIRFRASLMVIGGLPVRMHLTHHEHRFCQLYFTELKFAYFGRNSSEGRNLLEFRSRRISELDAS
jgi:hypothetical protein